MTESTNEIKNNAPPTLKYSAFIYANLIADLPMCLLSLAFGGWLLYKASNVGYLLTYGIAAVVIGILGLTGNSLLLKKVRAGLSFGRINIVFTFVAILALASLLNIISPNVASVIVMAEVVRIGFLVSYALAISKTGDAFENFDFSKDEQQSFNDRYKKNV